MVAILRAPAAGANVRHPGEDVRAGQVVLAAGTALRPAELGLLASLGHPWVRVHRRPRVGILSTGDEVVAVDQTPGPGQIRDSNGTSLAALVQRLGGIAVPLGIARDRLDELERLLARQHAVDAVISSAGVSAGDYDVVRQALARVGSIELWQVNMKPGRPLAFGRLGPIPYLGLPGNPVAAMVSFEVFARPLLLRLQGRQQLDRPPLWARALEPLENGSARRHFVRVHIDWQGDGLVARLAGDQGAGILTSMVLANGLAIVREGVTAIEAGQSVEVLPFDWE
jgi:molybdopterin molybdotransferase